MNQDDIEAIQPVCSRRWIVYGIHDGISMMRKFDESLNMVDDDVCNMPVISEKQYLELPTKDRPLSCHVGEIVEALGG